MGFANVGVAIGLGTIVGVIGLTGCSRYLNQSKAAEARNSVGAIGRSASAAYERERMPTNAVLTPGASIGSGNRLCGSAPHTVPASASDVKGKKYMSTPSDWQEGSEDIGWKCLGFEMSSPQYFMYGYRITGNGDKQGDSFTATASGDLDGDGVMSKYELTGKVNGSSVAVSPTLVETNPLE